MTFTVHYTHTREGAASIPGVADFELPLTVGVIVRMGHSITGVTIDAQRH